MGSKVKYDKYYINVQKLYILLLSAMSGKLLRHNALFLL